jgi:hypothetical protein
VSSALATAAPKPASSAAAVQRVPTCENCAESETQPVGLPRWLIRSGTIQTKPTIGAPNDIHEQEADAVAERVMRSTSNPPIQRKCSACAEGTPCPDCLQYGGAQAKETHDRTRPPEVESLLPKFHRGNGRPLSGSVRAFFEPRFGTDLSQVRVHTDHDAGKTARSLHARAFTIGQDIAFGSGQFAPDTAEGKRLLAHELTHTIQQRDSAVSGQGAPPIQRAPDDGGQSIWDTISQTVKDAGSSVVAGAADVGHAVVTQARELGDAALQGTENAGAAIAQAAKSAASSVVQAATEVGAQLAALQEKLAQLTALFRDYSPLPDGVIRLKEELVGEKARLLALNDTLTAQENTTTQNDATRGNTATLENLSTASMPLFPLPLGRPLGGRGGGGGDDFEEPAGGCGLCYGTEKGKIGPREAGNAAHKVIQNMLKPAGVIAELPWGDGRIDLAVVRPDVKQIEIAEIKPANEAGMEAGIEQIEKRLRALPTLAKYEGYTAVPLAAPVASPIRFVTGAPICEDQPGYCYSQDMSVAMPSGGGLYLYFCEPSYRSLRLTCKCKCSDWEWKPFPWPSKERAKKRSPKINWDKIALYGTVTVLALAVVAALVCAFFGTGTIVGIPIAAACAAAGLAAGGAMLALLATARKEPDTVA